VRATSWCVTAVAVAALVGAGRAQGQAPAGPGGFVLARYATRSALAVYAGYPAGPVLAIVAIIQNPRTQYREEILAVGEPLLSSATGDLTGVIAAASTSDGWFTQAYLLPSWRSGRVSVTGTFEYYEPLQRAGVRELDVAPATAMVALSARLGIGASWVASLPAGRAASHAAGPALRVLIPRGTLTLDVLRGLANAPSELRLTVQWLWR